MQFYEGQQFYHQVCALLSDAGYRLVGMYDIARSMDGYISFCDGLFVLA